MRKTNHLERNSEASAEGLIFDDAIEEIEKIVKAILDHHELIIGITDKVNTAIISRLKNLISND
jgi:hypothetical protein